MRRKSAYPNILFLFCAVSATLVGFPVYGGEAISEEIEVERFRR